MECYVLWSIIKANFHVSAVSTKEINLNLGVVDVDSNFELDLTISCWPTLSACWVLGSMYESLVLLSNMVQ
jgi:multisubunit Na+/H+ antiporter MnhE subunit